MLNEGQQLGDYEITERLGQDEVGAVFKARQISTGRFATIAVIDPALAANQEIVGRFRRDAEVAAALQHANLLRVFGAGESAGCHFVAMEFVPDESLIARIKRKGRIGPENAIAICIYLAGALDYACKQAGLIHRDIKPERIFVSRDGNVKMGAFGMAREFGEFQPPTSGALPYISPEQAQGLRDVDLRANIYSIGCILYHMLSGRTPYEGVDATEVMTKHVNEPPPDIRAVWPACPTTLAAVIRRTMQKAPAARYQSYDELSTALRHAYDALSAPPATVPIARRDKPVAAVPASVIVVPPPAAAAPAPVAVARAPVVVAPTPMAAAPAPVAVAPAPVAVAPAPVAVAPAPVAVAPAPVAVAPAPVTVAPAPVAGAPGAPVTKRLAPAPPMSRPAVTARLAPSLTPSGRPIVAPPMSARPIAPPPGTVQPVVEAPAVEGNRKKRILVWTIVIVAVCVAIGIVLYFVFRKKDASGAASPPAESVESPPGLPKASKKKPFVNTLGMPLVPVRGANALFCIWETRVKDYAAYAQGKEVNDTWTKQEYRGTPVGRDPEHPVCGVSWEDAVAFCNWLTEKEAAEGRLPGGARYRLPKDAEWSHAVGLVNDEGSTPKERSGKNVVDFPWGKTWPPPEKAGSYADSAYHEKFPKERVWIHDYNDGFSESAPVGSFPPNEFGIHDLSGNVWEWCDDLHAPGSKDRVLRGASWIDCDRGYLLASYRIHYPPGSRYHDYGFRCVLAVAETQ